MSDSYSSMFPFRPTIFDANAGPNAPMSYQSLLARRKIAEALLGKRSPYPKTLGEGLTSLGENIANIALMNRLDQGEAQERAKELGAADKAGLDPDATPLPYPRLPPPDRFDPAIPSNSRVPGLRRTSELLDEPGLDQKPGLDQIAIAMTRPSFTTASADRPDPMQLPPAGSTGNAPARFGPSIENPATGARRLLPTQPPPDRFSREFGPLANVPLAPVDNAPEKINAALMAKQPMNGSSVMAYAPNQPDETLTPRTLARANAPQFFPAAQDNPAPPVRVAGDLATMPRPIPTDIPRAPAPAPAPASGPGFSPMPGPLPEQQKPVTPTYTPTPTAMIPQSMPTPPTQVPRTQREVEAIREWYRADNPNIKAIWQGVVEQEAAKRKFIDDRNVKEYDAKLEMYKTYVAAENVAAREAPMKAAELKKAEMDIAQRTPQPSATPRTVTLSNGYQYPANLGTPQSDQRTGVARPAPTPPGLSDKEWEAQQAPILAKRTEATATALPTFTRALRHIEQTLNHPGLEAASGFGGVLMRNVPGTAGYDFNARLHEINGENFLAGLNGLRGLGAVSNIEGQKTEQARANVDPNQSPDELKKTLLQLQMQLRSEMETAQRAMNMPVTAWRKAGDNSTFAPDIGEPGITRNGVPVIYIGGNPDLPSSYRRM